MALKSAALLGLGLTLLPASAERKPEWELGAGVAGIDFPLYRGAEERRNYLLPIPYVQYHGDFIKIDRDRMRGLLFRHGEVEIDIGLNGSVPVKSSDTLARSGMPDIDPILEIGPSLNVHLYYDEKRHTNFDLRMPLRAALTTNFSRIEQQGWLFQPTLNLDLRHVPDNGWKLGLQASLIYADQSYHQYFYGVAPQYATVTRSAYSAKGGYSGMQAITALSKRFPGYWVAGFVKWDNLNGAVIEDSPLVTRRQAFSVGFSISWILTTSDNRLGFG